MNDRLKTIVDLDQYPIHNLNLPIIKKLIERYPKNKKLITIILFNIKKNNRNKTEKLI
jgi:hypothetical protein